MTQCQSQKLLTLRALLQDSSPLSQLLARLRHLSEKYPDFIAPQFLNSQDRETLLVMAQELRLKEIEKALESLRVPENIVALELAKSNGYSVFFVLVPAGLQFDWHSHPRMLGISKSLFGELQVTTLDRQYLKPQKPSRFSYPQEQLRKEVLRPEGKSTATIDPVGSNIHRIRGEAPLSAFIDILMPDYPEDFCEFFRSRKQEEPLLDFKQMADSRDQLQIWQNYYQRVLRSQKPVVKNVILSFNHL